jgi:hypothetical protein
MLFMTAAIRRYRRLVWTTSAGAWIAGWLLAAPAAAQWRNLPTGSVPLDPTYYTKPWTVTTNARRTLGTELFEFICNENEKSTPHIGPHIK